MTETEGASAEPVVTNAGPQTINVEPPVIDVEALGASIAAQLKWTRRDEAKRFVPAPVSDHAGAMLALYPPADVAAKLSQPGGVEPSDMHLTLVFAGDADLIAAATLTAAARSAAGAGQVTGTVSGHARFTGGPQDALVALVDSPDLEELRRAAVHALEAAGVDLPRDHGFTPHITIGYLAPGDASPLTRLGAVPVSFDILTAVHATTRTGIPLSGGPGSDIGAPGEDGDMWGGKAMTRDQMGEPHPYTKTAESGAGNCECGAAEDDKIHTPAEGKGMAPPFVKKTPGGKNEGAAKGGNPITAGAFVSAGNVKGRVDLVVTTGVVPGATGSDDKPVEGSASAPAARVVVYESAGAGTWKATGKKIAAKASSLHRTPPLRTGQGKSVDETIVTMVIEYTGILPAGRLPDPGVVRQVFDRGVASWPGEAKTALTPDQWGMGRVEAFLHAATGDRPEGYRGDDDLLPEA
jgi:2'-5' RNA ligase